MGREEGRCACMCLCERESYIFYVYICIYIDTDIERDTHTQREGGGGRIGKRINPSTDFCISSKFEFICHNSSYILDFPVNCCFIQCSFNLLSSALFCFFYFYLILHSCISSFPFNFRSKIFSL